MFGWDGLEAPPISAMLALAGPSCSDGRGRGLAFLEVGENRQPAASEELEQKEKTVAWSQLPISDFIIPKHRQSMQQSEGGHEGGGF